MGGCFNRGMHSASFWFTGKNACATFQILDSQAGLPVLPGFTGKNAANGSNQALGSFLVNGVGRE